MGHRGHECCDGFRLVRDTSCSVRQDPAAFARQAKVASCPSNRADGLSTCTTDSGEERRRQLAPELSHCSTICESHRGGSVPPGR